MIALVALGIVIALMLVELRISNAHERKLLARGAVAPADPVFHTMRWAYPGVFIAMAIEGVLSGPASPPVMAFGALTFVAGKLLKVWAIVTLGERWTYKVLVLPGVPLVAAGPYRFLRHPNYVGVAGELIGMAFMTGARIAGPAGCLFFSWLLLRRIQAEDRALR